MRAATDRVRRCFALKRPGLAALFCLLLGAGAVAAVQETTSSQDDGAPTAEPDSLDRAAVQQSLEAARALEAAEGETIKDELIQRYAAALAALDSRDRWREARERFMERAESAPDRIAAAEAALDEPLPDHPVLGGLGLTEIEAQRASAELDAEATRAEIERLDDLVRRAPDRRLALPDEVAKTDQRLAELREEAAAEGGAGADAAIRMLRRAQIEELAAKAATLKVEETTFDERLAAHEAELRKARRVAGHAAERLARTVETLSQARREKAEEERAEAQRARQEALMQGEAFRVTADDTLRLREETVVLTQALDEDRRELERVRRSVESIGKRFQDTEDRVKITGLTTEVGRRLRQDRQRLREARATSTAFSGIAERLTRTQAELFDLDVVRESVLNEGPWVDALVKNALSEGRSEQDVRPVARKLVVDFRDAVAAKIKALNDRFVLLTSLKAQLETLDAKLIKYEEFVAKRILWIRSSDPVWRIDPPSVIDEAKLTLSPVRWSEALASLGRNLLGRPLPTVGILLALLALLGMRTRVRRALIEEGELAGQRTQTSVWPSLRALALSLLLAAPWAVLLFFVAWMIRTGVVGDPFVAALGEACHRTAFVVLAIEFLRVLSAGQGLAEAHFEWTPEAVRLMRRQSTWLLTILPAATLVGEFFVGVEGSWSASAGDELLPRLQPLASAAALSRTVLLVEIGSVLVFLWRILHPSRGVIAINARAALPDDWWARLRRAWFLIAVAICVTLTGITLLGYDFTARSLFYRFDFTLGYLLVLIVLRSLALRWVRLQRRSEALDKLRKKREELREKRLQEIERRRKAGEDVEELESEGLEVAPEEVDFAALSSDVRDLVRMFTGLAAIVGVIVIWASVLPALGVLDNVKLWDHQVTMTEIETDPSGVERLVPSLDIEPITLVNLLTALFALLLTWRAVRDLPSLLEIGLLRRLDLGSGERYAITTLLRYVLTLIGLVVVFNELGLSWSKLQWLVAGVSVGLGFGLQEIFANFVSGITLLFERPIRVGDWVTLGEVEGVVSRIRIRATTIRDRDLKELIVPNREFITGRFINWTLSDPVSRVTLRVGIAYGSDTETAIQLLLEAGRECPYAVADPAPNVVFMSFGESSLDFELRTFVAGREIQPRVIHDLHMRVDGAFRRAGIEISFPQRDLHLRSAPMLVKDGRESEA